MARLSLHCNNCAFIATTPKGGMAHVQDNPNHIVTGPGVLPGTTLTISLEHDPEKEVKDE